MRKHSNPLRRNTRCMEPIDAFIVTMIVAKSVAAIALIAIYHFVG